MTSVKLTYFKSSGKYYTHGNYESDIELEYGFNIYKEVRAFNNNGILPGLSSGVWHGYILVNPVDGVPALIDLCENN